MTTREKIEVLEAYEIGHYIDFCKKGTNDWRVCLTPTFNFAVYDYRKNEEQKEPDLIPFSFEDDLVGTVVTLGDVRCMITEQQHLGVVIRGHFVDYARLFGLYKFENDKPCGKPKK